MRPGVAFLIIGAALLGTGLLVGAFAIAGVTTQVFEGSVIIDKTPLEPGLSIAATMKDLPAGQQLLLSISGDPANVPLTATITQPDGTLLSTYNIDASPFTSAAATMMAGDHTLEVTNVGSTSVTLSGGLIFSPISGQQDGLSVGGDDPSIQSLVAYGVGILVAFALIIVGIVVLIIGTVKFLRARKSPPSTAASN